MRRRDVIKLLGGTALNGVMVAPAVLAQTPSAVPAPPQSPTWGFDLNGMERTTKAGDDFYRYCNGAWLDRTVIPPDRARFGTWEVLIDAAEQRAREILERGERDVEASARTDAAKFGTFYASFMDEARAEALDASPIAAALQRIRTANSRDDLAVLAGLPGEFFPSVLRVSVSFDSKNPGRYVVEIGQGGLGLPNRDYYLKLGFSDKKTAYLAYIAQLLGMIDWQAPQASAAAIVDFETAIAEASWPLSESRNAEKTYNPMSESALANAAPFPWRRLFDASGLGKLDHLVVGEITAVPKIAALYAQTPIDTLQAWQAFHVADQAAPFLSKRFVTAQFEFRGKTLAGTTELPARWKRGVRAVDAVMGEAVGRVYVMRYFSAAAKSQMEAMVEQIRLAFKDRIERLTWMDSATKARAFDKLARINVKVGYPNKWRDYSSLNIRPGDLLANQMSGRKFLWMRRVNRLDAPVDRDEWLRTPQTVNAYYSRNLNEIVFPAGILQAPFFDPAADAAVNYGAIGVTIGHELTHGFDDNGRRFDGAGMLSNWWADKDLELFTARAAALGHQYDTFELFPGEYVNGKLTMGENIADLGGISIAFDAYHRSLGGKPAPVLDGFTGDQRFFLGFAQVWREVIRNETARRLLVTDVHAPQQVRVNGVVRNVDAWYEAFGVEPGDRLYVASESRVRIW